MTDIQSSNKPTVSELQARIYGNLLNVLPNYNPLDDMDERYDLWIRKGLKRYEYPITDDSRQLPPAEIRNDIFQNYLREKQAIENLFAQGTCLCFNPSPVALPARFQNKFDKLEQQKMDNFGFNYVSPMCVFEPAHTSATYFTNGLVLYSDKQKLDDFVAKFKAKGYKVNETKKASRGFINNVADYAAVLYVDQLTYGKRLEPKEYAEKILEGGHNICLSLSGDVNLPPELRTKYLLFKDGRRVTLSGMTSFDTDKITIFEQEDLEKVFLMQKDFMSQDYIDEIEHQSRVYSWYVSESQYHRQYQNTAQTVQTTPPSMPEITPKIQNLIENLCHNNRCLSLLPFERIMPYEDEFAIFADGRCLIADRPETMLSHFHLQDYEYEIKRQNPNIVLKREKVPAFYLPLIYQEVYKKQKSAIQIYLEKLKKKAKQLKTEENISHHEALDIVAQCRHFANWRSALRIGMRDALLYLQEENRIKERLYWSLSAEAKIYGIKHNIDTTEDAQKAFAKAQGFASWTRLMLQDINVLNHVLKEKKN